MEKEALDYHAKGRPGKIEVNPTKETDTQKDLALAYSPGVAAPCLAIEADARKNVCNAINLCNELTKFEETQKRKGKVFYQSEEYNKMRQLLCSEIAQINCVANVIGQGRDDLDATVLFAADEVQRKVTKS